MTRLGKALQKEKIEYRRGSAGDGNQLRQPYVLNMVRNTYINPSKLAPVKDHVHFFGMHMGTIQV